MVISLLPTSQALDFSVSSPSKVNLNESFKVVVESELVKDYDVKVFVYKDKQNNIISKILEGNQWKNPYYYLNGVYPNQKEFTIRVITDPGERVLCARLRRSEQSTFEQDCINITIDGNTLQISNTSQPSDSSPSVDITSQDPELPSPEAQLPAKNSSKNSFSDNSQNNSQNLGPTINNDEILILNPITTLVTQETYTTPAGKTTQYLLYGFTTLCIIIIILLALRRL